MAGSVRSTTISSSTYDHDTGIEPNNRVGRFTGHANLSVAPSEKYDIATSFI